MIDQGSLQPVLDLDRRYRCDDLLLALTHLDPGASDALEFGDYQIGLWVPSACLAFVAFELWLTAARLRMLDAALGDDDLEGVGQDLMGQLQNKAQRKRVGAWRQGTQAARVAVHRQSILHRSCQSQLPQR